MIFQNHTYYTLTAGKYFYIVYIATKIVDIRGQEEGLLTYNSTYGHDLKCGKDI